MCYSFLFARFGSEESPQLKLLEIPGTAGSGAPGRLMTGCGGRGVEVRMEGVLVATSQDGEVSANLTDDHGLTGAMRLCDVNPGRITAVTCPASDVGLDTVSAAHVSDVVDLGELSQRSFGGVGAVIVSTIHLKVMLPRHPESSVGVKLGSTT